MSRKKRENKKKKHQPRGNTGVITEKTSAEAFRPDQTVLNHLSGDWREFYQMVIARLNK